MLLGRENRTTARDGRALSSTVRRIAATTIALGLVVGGSTIAAADTAKHAKSSHDGKSSHHHSSWTPTMTLNATLTSPWNALHSVGTATTYGFNELTGTSTSLATPTAIELLGGLVYVKGVGHFNGFVTFTFSDSSTLGVSMNGLTRSSGGAYNFKAPLRVIGGTGTYANTHGFGLYTGTRTGPVGSPISGTFTLRLHQDSPTTTTVPATSTTIS